MKMERRESRSGVGFPRGLIRGALWSAGLAAALTLGCAKEGASGRNQAPAEEPNGETAPPSDIGGVAAPSTAPISPSGDLARGGAAAASGATSRGFISATAMAAPPMPPVAAPPPVLLTIDPTLVGPEQAESVTLGGADDQAR